MSALSAGNVARNIASRFAMQSQQKAMRNFGMAGKAAIVGGAAATGAAIGSVGGRVWDYEGRGWEGAKIGAGIAGVALGARGMAKMGLRGMSSSLSAARMSSGLGMNAAIGAGIGYATGPTDSSLANIGMGAMAGGTGGLLGARIAKAAGPRWLHTTKQGFSMALTQGRSRPGKLHLGKFAGSGSSFADRWNGANVGISTAKIGATAGALMMPSMGHALIGGSRKDKKMNTFNR